MNNEEMICKNCKYHYIEELTFDYPQSCCCKRSATTEQWCKCNDFEYGDRYIEQLQQENQKYKEVIDKLKEYENNSQLTRSVEGTRIYDGINANYEIKSILKEVE